MPEAAHKTRNVVTLGETRHEGDKQQPILLDVDESKHGFLTGSTGAGKSNTLRVIVEEVRGVKTRYGGKAHVAVFETEGDLRPALETLGDFVIFDCDGPLQVSPETAGLIARQQVELGFDAIFDLTDWGAIDRGEIIANYSQALADLKLEHSPRAYGRKLFVFYDEAQKYAPELSKQQKGVDYPAAPAIIDVVSVGRKRGISAWIASQRPAKVRADIRAECDIVIAGKLNRSDDRDTVLKEMGVAARERSAVADRMRRFKKGDCLVIGEGLFDEPTLAHIKKGRTEVPEDYGIKARETPPMSEAMKQVVSQLADIKQRAAKEIRDLDEARAHIAEVERENERLKLAQKEAPAPILQGVPREEVDRLVDAAMQRAEDHVHAAWLVWADEHRSRIGRAQNEIAVFLRSIDESPRPGHRSTSMMDTTPETPPRAPRVDYDEYVRPLSAFEREDEAISEIVANEKRGTPPSPVGASEGSGGGGAATPAWRAYKHRAQERDLGFAPEPPRTAAGKRHERQVTARIEAHTRGDCSRADRILNTIATLERVPGLAVTTERVAAVMGIHPRGGSYLQEVKDLDDAGLVTRDRGALATTPEGRKRAKPQPLPRSLRELGEWSNLEPRTLAVFEAILKVTGGPEHHTTTNDVAAHMGVHPRGGSFLEEFKRLEDRGLITRNRGELRVQAWLKSVVSR